MFLCHFALCAENNDSQLMGISKKEFTRVISGIIESKASGNDDVSRDNEETVAEDDYVENNHRMTMAHREDLREAAVQSRRGVQNKRDSLYFLQRAMQAREGTLSTDDGERVSSNYSPRSQLVSERESFHSFILVHWYWLREM